MFAYGCRHDSPTSTISPGNLAEGGCAREHLEPPRSSNRTRGPRLVEFNGHRIGNGLSPSRSFGDRGGRSYGRPRRRNTLRSQHGPACSRIVHQLRRSMGRTSTRTHRRTSSRRFGKGSWCATHVCRTLLPLPLTITMAQASHRIGRTYRCSQG